MSTTHVIITFTKGRIFINAKENDALTQVGSDDYFEYSGGKIKGSAIAEIITLGEYYNRHPEERAEEREIYTAPREQYESIEKRAERSQQNFRGLLTGLKQYCDEHPNAEKARAMYVAKIARYKEKYAPEPA